MKSENENSGNPVVSFWGPVTHKPANTGDLGCPHQACRTKVWALREATNPGPGLLPVGPRRKVVIFLLEQPGPVGHPSSPTCSLCLDTRLCPSAPSGPQAPTCPPPLPCRWEHPCYPQAHLLPPGTPALAWDPRRVCAKSVGRPPSSPNRYLPSRGCCPPPSRARGEGTARTESQMTPGRGEHTSRACGDLLPAPRDPGEFAHPPTWSTRVSGKEGESPARRRPGEQWWCHCFSTVDIRKINLLREQINQIWSFHGNASPAASWYRTEREALCQNFMGTSCPHHHHPQPQRRQGPRGRAKWGHVAKR